MRRVAAIVLPRLACELAERRSGLGREEPLGVLVDDEPDDAAASSRKLDVAILAAVNERALRYGARPGQRVAEAAAFVGRLRTAHVSSAELRRELGEVAEIALGLGTTAAIELQWEPTALQCSPADRGCYPGGAGAGPEDTVWLDVSGCARLLGGEDLLREELCERLGVLGHCVRVTIADGPRIAQAIARWGPRESVVPAGRSAQALGALPIAALPFRPSLRAFFGKLGILRVAELGAIDRAGLASRLGREAPDLLALLAGQDEQPLFPYTPPNTIIEQASFEHEIRGTEPLLFVLGGLAARAASRLAARGEAAGRLVLELDYDRAMARLAELDVPTLRLVIELPLPLRSAEELLRALRAKIEASELAAPVVAVTLTLAELGERAAAQLDLSRRADADPRALPALLAELEASLGTGRVGVLCWGDSHRPEAQSVLRSVVLDHTGRPSSHLVEPPHVEPAFEGESLLPWWWSAMPTRLLSQPWLLGPVTMGALVTIERELYVVDKIRFEMRLDRVEWWTPEPLSRDYARAWLHGTSGGAEEHVEAWIFFEPSASQGFLHGWFD